MPAAITASWGRWPIPATTAPSRSAFSPGRVKPRIAEVYRAGGANTTASSTQVDVRRNWSTRPVIAGNPRVRPIGDGQEP